jgi:hypothetical protein
MNSILFCNVTPPTFRKNKILPLSGQADKDSVERNNIGTI